jgi:hypothetical protein
VISFNFPRWLSRSGFQRRSAAVSRDRMVYKLADRSGYVALDRPEWEALGERFDTECKMVSRRTNWVCCCAPFAVFLFGMTLGQILPGAGLIIVAAIFIGPAALYVWHRRGIERVADAIEADLARRPRVAEPQGIAPPPVPRWLEIAGFFLIGPGLIIQVYGSLNPDAYRNTPLSGTQLNAFGLAGFVALAAIICLRRRARPAAAAGDEPLKADEPRARRTDAIARAKRAAS